MTNLHKGAIIVAAFFAPAIMIRIMWLMWGAPIEDLNLAAGMSLLFGVAASGVVCAILFHEEMM